MTKKGKAKKAGWAYSGKPHHELNLMYACRDINNDLEIMYEDKIQYDNDELRILLKIGGTNKKIHMVKKIFDGIIVK